MFSVSLSSSNATLVKLSTTLAALLLWGVSGAVMAQCPAGMDGTGADAANACQVTTWAQLQAIGDNSTTLGLHYKLMNDLAADDAPDNFLPIGDGTDRFTGHFDGNFKRIIGLVINRSPAQNIGLFGATDQNSTIKALGLVGVDVTGGQNSGALVGSNRGRIDKVFATGKVTATARGGGGLIGLYECWSPATGLEDAYSLVEVAGADFTGGLIGDSFGTSCSPDSVKRSYTTGNVTSSSSTGVSAVGPGQLLASQAQVYVDQLAATVLSGGATARLTGELKRSSSGIYSTWDFSENGVWGIIATTDADETKEQISYPFLRGFVYDEPGQSPAINPYPGLSAKWIPVSTWEELSNEIKKDLTANYSLQNTLDANVTDYATYAGKDANGGEGWIPLGPFVTSASLDYFRGEFKGNGHSIDGLYIDRSGSAIGLFANLQGKVSDLIISNFDITGGSSVAALAGQLHAGGEVVGVLVESGKVTATASTVAGLVGTATAAGRQKIRDSAVDDVSLEFQTGSSTLWSGGLVGRAFEIDFERVYFSGSIEGPSHFGGLVGEMVNSTLKDAYSVGVLTATATATNVSGGVAFVNLTTPTVIENVYTAMAISTSSSAATTGGVIGGASSGLDALKAAETTFYDVAQGNVIPGSSTRGQAASTADMLTTEFYTEAGWDFEKVWEQVEDAYPVFKAFPRQNPPPQPTPIVCPTGLEIADDGACLIGDWDDLKQINDSTFSTFRLTASLNKGTAGYTNPWTPLSAFGGTLDGAGHTISDLIITTGGGPLGLFSELGQGSKVKNLALLDIDFDGSGLRVGAFAGTFAGNLESVYASGSIKGSGYLGGLVGDMTGGAIRASQSDVAIEGSSDRVGGLVGEQSAGKIQNSLANAQIKSTSNFQGGLVGFLRLNSSIDNSYSISSFTDNASGRRGLAVPGSFTGEVRSSYWDKNVTGVTVSENAPSPGASRTTPEMKSKSTFAGWDFDGVWSIVDETVDASTKRVSYPYLTKLAEFQFIDITDDTAIGAQTIARPLELAATSPLTPAASATNVEPFTAIRVKFAEPISTTTATSITLKDSAGATIPTTRAVAGDTLSIVPTQILSYDETYTVEIPTNAVTSSTVSTRKNLTIAWSFSTQSGTVAGGDGCPGRMINVLDPKVSGELLCAVTDWGQLASISSNTPLSSTDARTPLGLNYILMNDLDKNTAGYDALVGSRSGGWRPIGFVGTTLVPFHGVFDGGGHVIRDLFINAISNNVGLFGRIAQGVVKDLVLEEVDISGGGNTSNQAVGALAAVVDQAGQSALPAGSVGQPKTAIERVFASGRVGGAGPRGGLVGQVSVTAARDLEFNEVGFVGRVDGNFGNLAVRLGGLIGEVKLDGGSSPGKLSIDNAYFIGNVEGSNQLGGLIGVVDTNTEVTAKDVYTSATIKPPGTGRNGLGALFGTISGSVVSNDDIYWHNTGPNWETNSTGTVVASAIGTGSSPTHDSDKFVEIEKLEDLAGVAAETTMPAFFSSDPPLWESVTKDTEASFGDLFPILSNVDIPAQVRAQLGPRQCSDEIANGYGIDGSPCEISSWSELRAIGEFPESPYVLTANLSKSTPGYLANFTPLPNFLGTFDGANLTISDLRIDRSGSGAGLFTSLGSNTSEPAIIENLVLANIDITGGNDTGALVSTANRAVIRNVHVISGQVNGQDRVGGLMGGMVVSTDATRNIIEDSSSAASVNARSQVGGLIGEAAGTIARSSASGDVVASAGEAGGLVGRVAINNSAMSIRDSFTTGAVSATSSAGGLIGAATQSNTVVIERAFSAGDIGPSGTSSGSTFGGLIGALRNCANSRIEDAYSVSSITGNSVVGGLAGDASCATFDRVFFAGDITFTGTSNFVGGLFGASSSAVTVTKAFWDTEASGRLTSHNVDDETAGLSTAAMQGTAAATSMADLGFGSAGAWQTVEIGAPAGAFKVGYPILKLPVPVAPQLAAQRVGLNAIGITATGPALELFFDVVASKGTPLNADNLATLAGIATAAEIVIGVANGSVPRTALNLATLEVLGVTGVDSDTVGAAQAAVAAVINLNDLTTLAGLQAVIDAGIASAAVAQPIFDGFIGGAGNPPAPADYAGIGVLGVTAGNVPAINDILINAEVESGDTGGIQHLVDAYNSILASLADGVSPTLEDVDYAALGLGEWVTDNNVADLLNSLLGALDAETVAAWSTTTPVSTYTELKQRAELAARVIASAVNDPSQPANLEGDLAALGLSALISTKAEIDFFNEVIASRRPDQVSSLDKLQAIAVAVDAIQTNIASAGINDFAAIGLPLTTDALPLFLDALSDQTPPVTYAIMAKLADAAAAVIAVANKEAGPVSLTEAVLADLGIDISAIGDKYPEVYLAIAAAAAGALNSIDKLQDAVDAAVTAANTHVLTVVNGSFSGPYLAGETVSITARSADEGQQFAGWTVTPTSVALADVKSSTTTFTMPSGDVTVEATYEVKPPRPLTINVTRGTGGGATFSGSEVTISADLAGANQAFSAWRVLTNTQGVDVIVANPSQPVTTVVVLTEFANQTISIVADYVTSPQTFNLNVGAGNGSGEYEQGESVAISANPAPANQRFDRWRGDAQFVANPSDPNTRVTMPAAAVSIVASYAPIPTPKYTLAVTNGEGDGLYEAGTAVTISADVPDVDQLFDRWRGDTAFVTNVNDATTTVNMPAGNITLRASYRDAPPTEYVLTVEGGSGSGDYVAGDVVTLSAGLAPAGKVFDQWAGQTARVANVNQPNTTLTMPDSAVTVRAVYKDLPPQTFTLSVSGGSGSGDYSQGRVVSIAAAPAAAGQVFDRWIGQTAAIANVNQANTTLTMPGSSVSIEARYVVANPEPPVLRTGGGRGGRGGALPNDMFLQSAGVAAGSRGTNKWSANSGIVMRGQSVSRQDSFDLIEQTVPAGTVVFIEAPDAPDEFYFDKWVGQTAFVDNIHQPNTTVAMPNHDVTVLAQYRSFDGETIITLAANVVSSTPQALPAGAAGTVVELKVAPTITLSGRSFVFDYWEGQTAYVGNILLPETTVTRSNAPTTLRAIYRAKPSGTIAVTAPAGTTLPEAIEAGTYISLSKPTEPASKVFELWTGQTSTVEDISKATSRMYVSANAVVLTAQFAEAADETAVDDLLGFASGAAGSTAPADAAAYSAAGISGASDANVSAYNDALVAIGGSSLSIAAVQAMVSAYNAILSAANSGTAASLNAAQYAAIGVTAPTTAAGLALLNDGIAAAEPEDVDTVAEVQAIANAAARLASLAEAGTGTPTAADYSAVGISAVVASNTGAYNSAVAKTKAVTAADIQKAVTAYNAILAAAGSAGASGLTAANYADIGVEGVTATTLGLLNSAVGSQAAAASNTVAKLQAMATAAARILATASTGQDTGVTVADFTALGIQGIDDSNLAAALALVAEANVGDLQTTAALQALLSEVLTPPLPVPTLSLWALMLMALLLMAMAWRQSGVRRRMR